jgi:hypothetical protein
VGGLFGLVSARSLANLFVCFFVVYSAVPADEGSGVSAPDEVAYTQRVWVKRGRNAAVVVVATWVAWVLIIQVLATESFPESWFVRSPDQSEFTGW